MIRRRLEPHQQLARQHVSVLLIVRKLHRLRDAHPAIDIAVEDCGLTGLEAHMHVLEPVQIVPTHEFHIGAKIRRQPLVIGHKIDIVAITDVLADLLLAGGVESGAVGFMLFLTHPAHPILWCSSTPTVKSVPASGTCAIAEASMVSAARSSGSRLCTSVLPQARASICASMVRVCRKLYTRSAAASGSRRVRSSGACVG